MFANWTKIRLILLGLFRILSGGSDAKIKIWDLKSKTIVREIVGHKTPVG